MANRKKKKKLDNSNPHFQESYQESISFDRYHLYTCLVLIFPTVIGIWILHEYISNWIFILTKLNENTGTFTYTRISVGLSSMAFPVLHLGLIILYFMKKPDTPDKDNRHKYTIYPFFIVGIAGLFIGIGSNYVESHFIKKHGYTACLPQSGLVKYNFVVDYYKDFCPDTGYFGKTRD